MKHIVQFSGGIGSWAAAKRVAAQHGTDDLLLVFCDTLTEDEDLYRFLYEAHENVGGTLVHLCDGRDIWQVFNAERFVSAPHGAACTRVLKQEISDRWRVSNFAPDECVIYVGIDWSEMHRFEGDGERPGLRKLLHPYRVEAPMCDPPYMTKNQMLQWLEREGIKRPRLYELGFAHNNCGGRCVKAGIGHWVHLLRVLPERYAECEAEEQKLIALIGRPILRWRSGPKQGQPMSLRELREHVQGGGQWDLFEWGGCACFAA